MRARRSDRWLGGAAIVVGLVLQAWSLSRAWTDSGRTWEVGLLVGGGLGVAWGLGRLDRTQTPLLRWLYLGLALFLPPYGSPGALLLFVVRRYSTASGLARDYADYIDAETDDGDDGGPTGSSSVDQMIQHELNVQSYMDIMHGPDRLLKKALIGRILATWTPNAVALLRVALGDEDYEIRSYASTALTEIESRMSENLLRRRRICEAGGDAADAMRLAEAYLDYAGSGLLDGATAEHYVDLARQALAGDAPTAGGPDHLAWLSLQAQAAREAGDGDAERRLCEHLLKLQPEHPDALRQLCDLDFRQGRLSDLRLHARRLVSHTPPDHPAAAAAQLWLSATGPSA